jgi:hypothetical protein
MTEKQRLAKIRNWKKFQITGMFTNNFEGLTPYEQETMKLINNHLVRMVVHWDNNSLELGLIPNKLKKNKNDKNKVLGQT